jgi:beta-phosphoglucomutase
MNGIIWDMDGTLVDTAELHFQAWQALAAELKKPFTHADFAGTFGWRNPEILPKVFGPGHTQAQIAAWGDRKEVLYRQAARNGVTLLPGARKLLEGLQQAGFLQAIGSSAPRANLDLILDITDTHHFFAAVVSMEETQKGKPDPEVFLRAAEKLGVPAARCLVIEDAPVGIQAAKAGGMRALGVTFVGHHSAESLRAAGADRLVETLEGITVAEIRNLFSEQG